MTIATGDERYYVLAANLLHSYKAHSEGSIPFAILCDRENAYTAQFDRVIRIKSAFGSYMDKLQMYRYSPYDETIFIDADSLILHDLKELWTDFATEDDVSCYGVTLPIDGAAAKRAWFSYEDSGRWKKDIHFLVGLHGGLYYFRKTERCAQIFEKAILLSREYDQYQFKDFQKPADEPVLAMAMAIHGCHPCEKPPKLVFVHAYYGRIKTNRRGDLLIDGKKTDTAICHFATRNTKGFLYCYLAALCEADYCVRMDKPRKRISMAGIRLKTALQDGKLALRYGLKRIAKRCLSQDTIQKIKQRMCRMLP